MIRKVKEVYESKFNEPLAYRLICTDNSWAAIHAIFENLNNERRSLILAQSAESAQSAQFYFLKADLN